MTTINVVDEAMRAAQADIQEAVHRLAESRAKADRRVTALLDSGWTGVAADAFGEAWTDWRLSADQVKDGLDSMGRLIGAVHRDLIHQDDASQQSLDRISARIVERLS